MPINPNRKAFQLERFFVAKNDVIMVLEFWQT